MRKIFIAAFFIAASFTLAAAQEATAHTSAQPAADDLPNLAQAPKEMNGIGRLDLRVVDQNGQPVEGAYAELKSKRTDGFLCEAWGSTNARGAIALPPIHMGELTLSVKAKGYKTQKLTVARESLAEPVRVVLQKK
jgi:hypothetical protein